MKLKLILMTVAIMLSTALAANPPALNACDKHIAGMAYEFPSSVCSEYSFETPVYYMFDCPMQFCLFNHEVVEVVYFTYSQSSEIMVTQTGARQTGGIIEKYRYRCCFVSSAHSFHKHKYI